MGCEYKPTIASADTLNWIKEYGYSFWTYYPSKRRFNLDNLIEWFWYPWTNCYIFHIYIMCNRESFVICTAFNKLTMNKFDKSNVALMIQRLGTRKRKQSISIKDYIIMAVVIEQAERIEICNKIYFPLWAACPLSLISFEWFVPVPRILCTVLKLKFNILYNVDQC